MLSVTIQGPVIIEASELAALIQLVNVPVLVEAFEAVTPGPTVNGNGRFTPMSDEALAKAAEIVKQGATAEEGNPPELKSLVTSLLDGKPAPEGKKRHRRTKAEMEAAKAAANGQTAHVNTSVQTATTTSSAAESAQATGVTGEAVATGASFDVLRDRFAGLIDKDYDEALNLLQKFGVDRFGALPEKDFALFGAELDAFGV